MPLFLVELIPTTTTKDGVVHAVDALVDALGPAAELVETQVTASASRAFVILDAEAADPVETLSQTGLPGVATITAPAAVRLVGADLDEIKAARPEASHLVEWDLPDGLDMPTYLARKAAKTPLYDQVPEVSFLRTYVREDMVKCLCFYDAPDVDAVVRARDVVSAPVNRLHALGQSAVTTGVPR